MTPAHMDEHGKVSLAKETARLCSLPDRMNGVTVNAKNDKQEKKQKRKFFVDLIVQSVPKCHFILLIQECYFATQE